ncbi:hypothetical protein L596_016815 [Steinernema carpocapsae]|uniref:Uncharacterized protein n=1 Tax=Steinernema carpocapsae TaxID=34508 RepID=A0A4U5NK40_STECR|nr:hypothetical protein L596_016815 [Steinernema carpocapsae]
MTPTKAFIDQESKQPCYPLDSPLDSLPSLAILTLKSRVPRRNNGYKDKVRLIMKSTSQSESHPENESIMLTPCFRS